MYDNHLARVQWTGSTINPTFLPVLRIYPDPESIALSSLGTEDSLQRSTVYPIRLHKFLEHGQTLPYHLKLPWKLIVVESKIFFN